MKAGWEYKVISFEKVNFFSVRLNQEALEQQINECGRQGWELVSTESRYRYYRDNELLLFFKRPC